MAAGAGSRMWWMRQWFWVSTSGWARCVVLRCRTSLRAVRGQGVQVLSMVCRAVFSAVWALRPQWYFTVIHILA
jgi:hypothetical protein